MPARQAELALPSSGPALLGAAGKEGLMPPISLTRPSSFVADPSDRGLRRRLITDLRGAIGRGEMSVHYQPRIFLADGRLAGAEALLRWQHPLHGAIPPHAFIPLAEASDLILRLG